MVNQETLPQIVGVLLGSIRDMPHIAEKVCYAMAQLAAGFKDDDSTSLFSPYFKEIVGALLDAVLPGPHALCSIRLVFSYLSRCGMLLGADSNPVLQSCLMSLTGHGKDRCDVAELFTPTTFRLGSCKAASMPGGHA